MYCVNDIEFPSEYLCPITLMPMIDPVVLVDGNSYQRAAIVNCFNRGIRKSPLTNLMLNSLEMIPNRTLKKGIQAFRDISGLLKKSAESRANQIIQNIAEEMQQFDKSSQGLTAKKLENMLKNYKKAKGMVRRFQKIRTKINEYFGEIINPDFVFDETKISQLFQQKKRVQQKCLNLMNENRQLRTELKIKDQQLTNQLAKIIDKFAEDETFVSRVEEKRQEIEFQREYEVISEIWYDQAAKALSEIDFPKPYLDIHITQSIKLVIFKKYQNILKQHVDII